MGDSQWILPGKPVACNYGLLSVNSGLLGGIVACDLKLLGFPGAFLGPSEHAWSIIRAMVKTP